MYSVLDRLYRYVDPRRAVEILAPSSSILGVEEIDVRDSLYRVLASDITSPAPRPWANISHVDGFAVRSSDTCGASSSNPVLLRLVKEVDSRSAHEYRLKPGETVFVETGHPVPEGADAVYPVESTRVIGDNVAFFKPARSGENIIPRGSDVGEKTVVARRGERITPALQKLLMDLGIPAVEVYEKPRVTIVSVGSELVDKAVPASTGKIPASSAYLVESILTYWGCNVVGTVKAFDEPGDIAEKTINALEKSHVVVSIGGVSMGPRDHTWTTLYRFFKPSRFFRGVKIHPGRSTSGMLVDQKIIVNLPGLPLSTVSGLVLVLIPLIHKLMDVVFKLPYIEVYVKNTVYFKLYRPFHKFRLVDLDYESMQAVIHDVDSYHVYPLVKADGFTLVPPGVDKVVEKTLLKTYFLEPLFSYKKTATLDL